MLRHLRLTSKRFLEITALMIVAIVVAQTWLFNPNLGCFNSVAPALAKTEPVKSEPYTWQNVAIGGMGFVTGLVAHPGERDLIYIRTDVGGAYRWNPRTASWIPLMDSFTASQPYFSIESIALDPSNPNVVYVAAGEAVLKSSDRGQTWSAVPLKTPAGSPVRMDGNGEWRWTGERLAVDPNNHNILYFGSRWDGLYQSRNRGKSWQKVPTFSTLGTAPGGIAFVLFDPNTRIWLNHRLVSRTIIAGVIGGGIYRSNDAGQTWSRIAHSPSPEQNPQQAALGRDGALYISFLTSANNPRGEVWKYARNRWSQITPSANKNYSAIAVDAADPNTILVTEYPLTPNGVYRSTNGGKNWTTIRLDVKTVPWWPDWHLYTLMGRIVIDPHHRHRVWLTNGFGVLRTNDISAQPSVWTGCMSNLEEFVTFVVKSPPLKTTPLLSGVADMGGFRHSSLTQFPPHTYDLGKFGDTTGIDFSEANPQAIARVGSFPGKGGREDSQIRAAYSKDAGKTWNPFAQVPPGAVNGKVAVSANLQATGYPVIVWTPQGDLYPYRSLDGGRTWLPVSGAPNRTILQLWFPSQAIASDRVDGQLFYLYKYSEDSDQGAFYHSVDSGATWTRTVTGLPNSYFHTVKAAPTMRGEVWLAVRDKALHRSSDAGRTFTRLAHIQQAREFTFGKAAPGRKHPTTFVYGVVDGVEGLFRSDDVTSLPGTAAAATWVKISDQRQALGNVNYLEGDRLNFGRVYVGTSGRGILYGQPQSKN